MPGPLLGLEGGRGQGGNRRLHKTLAQGQGKQAVENLAWGKQEVGYMSPFPGTLHFTYKLKVKGNIANCSIVPGLEQQSQMLLDSGH